MPEWMIYGANGYTGELIAREAARRGQRPLLAGRSAAKIEPLARELGCEWRAFPLEQIDLRGIELLLHCAGPFSRTSRPFVDACLEQRVHYLDITGEIAVFEAVLGRNAEAVTRGVTLLPGVGFDVVPSDCLAARLVHRLPDATELWLAFHNVGGGISSGTLKTSVERLPHGGAIRRDGRIVRVPLFHDVREIPFPSGGRVAATIPWGDVSTAFHTTGIANIQTYKSVHPRVIAQFRRWKPLLPLLRLAPVRAFALRRARRWRGPDEAKRSSAHIELWGRAANAHGDEVTMTLSTPDGYNCTVLTALACVEGVLAEPRGGAFTPASRFGADLIDHALRPAVSS